MLKIAFELLFIYIYSTENFIQIEINDLSCRSVWGNQRGMGEKKGEKNSMQTKKKCQGPRLTSKHHYK